MVKKLTDTELKEVLHRFLSNLSDKIAIDRSILFGSYAKETAHEWSDIDLMVISKDLPLDRPKGANGFALAKLAGFENLAPGLEVIGIHPQKLSNPVTFDFFEEVISTGKEFDLETKSFL